MFVSNETIDWISRQSEERDSRSACCDLAGRLTRQRRSTSFDQGMLLFGLAYLMDHCNGEVLSPFAAGWASMTEKVLGGNR